MLRTVVVILNPALCPEDEISRVNIPDSSEQKVLFPGLFPRYSVLSMANIPFSHVPVSRARAHTREDLLPISEINTGGER